MIAIVRKSDKPVITVFGGSDAVPIAVRVIPSTTAIRVKQVMHKIIAGANDSTVSSRSIFKLLATELPLANSLPPIETERSGKPEACA
jgi:UDP-N-acetylglucosamine:LPS N-acetylglucosamine transferase